MSTRRRRGLVAAILALAVLGCAAVVLGWGPGGGSAPQASGGDFRGQTATVTRHDLRTTTVVTGTYGSEPPAPVQHRSAGTGPETLTETAASGTVVRRADVLYRVDQHPVLLLYGRIPAYRTLRRGLAGKDVRELQENLVALGLLAGVPDGRYGATTKQAVAALQRRLGLRPTGRMPLGAYAVARGARRIAAGGAPVGTLLSDGTPVCRLTGVERRVRIPLTADQRAFARAGADAVVTLPDRSQVTGRILAVGAAPPPAVGTTGDEPASPDAGADSAAPAKTEPSYEARIRIAGERVRALADGSTISATLTRVIRRAALVVPTTALAARPGGGFQVRVVRGPSATAVPVRVGAVANGLAEIHGAVREGDRVAIPAGV